MAWYTLANRKARVQVIVSNDGGETFGKAVRIDDGNPIGRPQVVWLKDQPVVCWMERIDQNVAELRIRRPGGEALTVAKVPPLRSTGIPQMVTFGDELVFSWTLKTKESQVIMARVAGF